MICWNLCLCLPPRGNQNPIVKNGTRLFINWIKINKENKQTENTIPNDEQQQNNYIVIKRANNTLIMLWLHAFCFVINAKKIAMRFDRRAFDWNFRTRKNNNTLCVCVCACELLLFEITIDGKSANATQFKYLNHFSPPFTKNNSFARLVAAICSVAFLFELITWIKRLQSANNGARQPKPKNTRAHSLGLQCLFKHITLSIQWN